VVIFKKTGLREHMHGALSSLMHKVEETAAKNNDKDFNGQRSEGKTP